MSPADRGMDLVEVGETTLAVEDGGAGEPVVLVQTALTADELLPLGLALRQRGYRVLRYHRRGYGSSGPARDPGSIAADARDCADLMSAVGLGRAHVVSVSYGAAVALELAARRPDLVATTTAIEPPPTLLDDPGGFVAANEALLARYRSAGASAALDSFLTRLVGTGWRAEMERLLPGSVARMERDAATFFGGDVPALLGWTFGDADAAAVGSPLLYVGGTLSGPWFAAVRRRMLAWFPDASDVVVDGADHNLVLTHAEDVAEAVDGFLQRHPCR